MFVCANNVAALFKSRLWFDASENSEKSESYFTWVRCFYFNSFQIGFGPSKRVDLEIRWPTQFDQLGKVGSGS